jgi:uncharacterized coiled-coil DUF342 family protein
MEQTNMSKFADEDALEAWGRERAKADELGWEIAACTAEIDEYKRELIKHPNDGAETQRMISHLERKRAEAREKRDELLAE